MSVTRGLWQCLRCGETAEAPIYLPPEECPGCKVRYEVVKVLVGAHIAHEIPVQRMVGTEELNVVQPLTFMSGRNESALLEYFDIAERAHAVAKDARIANGTV